MAVQKIAYERVRLPDLAYRHLSEGILNGELKPGTRLLMDELAEQLGISRTPVREALHRLEAERVIEEHGRRGYVIRSLQDAELDKRYEAREAIEGYALALVAERGGEAVAHVRDAYERLCRLPQTTAQEVYAANRAIHRAPVEAVDNTYLLSMFDTIWNAAMASQVWADLITNDAGIRSFAEDHLHIVEAAESGDPAFARAQASDHIHRGRTLHKGHLLGT